MNIKLPELPIVIVFLMVLGLVLAALALGEETTGLVIHCSWVDKMQLGPSGSLLPVHGCRDGGCSSSKGVMVTSLAIAMKLLVFSWVPLGSAFTDQTSHFISVFSS